jgi:hypothetical protein
MKDPQTIHVMGKIANLMMGGVIVDKYYDPSKPVVNVHINGTLIRNTLIHIGTTINVMTHDTMETLEHICLRETPTILQLIGRSTMKLERILEYVLISIDSWEYPYEFMIL